MAKKSQSITISNLASCWKVTVPTEVRIDRYTIQTVIGLCVRLAFETSSYRSWLYVGDVDYALLTTLFASVIDGDAELGALAPATVQTDVLKRLLSLTTYIHALNQLHLYPEDEEGSEATPDSLISHLSMAETALIAKQVMPKLAPILVRYVKKWERDNQPSKKSAAVLKREHDLELDKALAVLRKNGIHEVDQIPAIVKWARTADFTKPEDE